MAQQIINRGTVQGDGTGDTGFVGTGKINDNFTELYGDVSNNTSDITAQQQLTNTNIPTQPIYVPVDFTNDNETIRLRNGVDALPTTEINPSHTVYFFTFNSVYFIDSDGVETITNTRSIYVLQRKVPLESDGIARIGQGYPSSSYFAVTKLAPIVSTITITPPETPGDPDMITGSGGDVTIVDLGTLTGLSDTEIVNAINANSPAVSVTENTLFKSTDGTDIKYTSYLGEQTSIGQGTTSILDNEVKTYANSTQNSDPAPTVSPSVKVFDVAGDSKFSADLLFQDSSTITMSKDVTTGALKFETSKKTYLTLSNVTDLRELILLDNPKENDIAIVNNYLNDVVTFRYVNNGWKRESMFTVACGVRIDEVTRKFSIIDDANHAPMGVRDVVTDPFGDGSFQFAIMCPNADNITGSIIATTNETDGLRGYNIGGSIGGRIGNMRVTATSGFPIIVDIDSGTGVVTFRDVASNNIPSSYFSYTYVESSGAFTINHPDIAIQKNIAPTVTPRSFISAGRGLLVTDFTSTSIEIKLGAPSTLASFPSFTVYRNGTYIVPIDLMKSSGNYIFTGQTRSTERLYAVALNNDNIMSLDQDSVNSGEFTVEFGFRVSADQTQLMTGGNGANFITVGGFSSNILRIAIGGVVFNTSTFVSLDEDHFLRLRRDTADNVYLKLDDNDEIELGNTSGDFTITDIGHRSGFTANRLNGYIRNLRLGNEYYNFSEQTGLTGASVYNSGGNPRTFTLTQGDVGTPMWIEF